MALSIPVATPDTQLGRSLTNTPDRDLDFDLVIVGGGIVGLTVALALKQSGLRIALVEASRDSFAANRGQAYNISPRSAQIFEQIGVWSALLPDVTPFRQIRLSDADYRRVVQFTPPDLGVGEADYLGYVAEHRVLLDGLESGLAENGGQITRLCPATVTDVEYERDRALVTLQIPDQPQPQRITTRLVVAADGAKSPLRQAAGIRTYGWQYWQACIVATIKPERHHHHTAYERFWPSGPFAILPIRDGRCRIVWTAPRAEAERLLKLEQSEFVEQLSRRYGDQMGELTVEGDRTLFPVGLMQCDRYVRHRLALVGDAAHRCHPVGGQGLNLGLHDAAVLAEVILSAHQHGRDIGDLRVLQRYDRRARRNNLLILAVTDVLVRLFSNHWLPLVWLRRLGLGILQTVPLFKQVVLRVMTGCYGRYRQPL